MKEEKKIRKKIKIEDLLPRDPIRVDLDAILGYVKGKTILVTGGGGSIGSEICRQLAGHDVGHLIIFDIFEVPAGHRLSRSSPQACAADGGQPE